jgi:hypothetical protein
MTINVHAPFNKSRCNLGPRAYQLEHCTEIVYESADVGEFEMQGIGSTLDWSRMLGFEQIAADRDTVRGAGNLGAKVGGKIGNKAGTKG